MARCPHDNLDGVPLQLCRRSDGSGCTTHHNFLHHLSNMGKSEGVKTPGLGYKLNAPPFLAGGLKQTSASYLWALTQCIIEQAQRDGTIKCGAVFDIVKAYNTFPRKPFLRLMARLGVPHHFIQAYDTFLRVSRNIFTDAEKACLK